MRQFYKTCIFVTDNTDCTFPLKFVRLHMQILMSFKCIMQTNVQIYIICNFIKSVSESGSYMRWDKKLVLIKRVYTEEPFSWHLYLNVTECHRAFKIFSLPLLLLPNARFQNKRNVYFHNKKNNVTIEWVSELAA